MRDPSPRAPFDQGLFLAHLNKGKALYESKSFPEAERELEEAYLLRPRDQKVLNLLGLVYFKQEKLEKAEEIYRKLTAESPEAHTLFYNLGLIYFKLGRIEDAEGAFLKAIELAPDNPKISFYLGSIYERLHRYQDAIYQYRQAGASLMVRRVEDKLAASGPPARPAVVPPPTAPTAPKQPRTDDTAEFKAHEVRAAILRQEEELGTAKQIQPVGPAVMAVPRERSDTNRFRLPEGMLPPRVARPFPSLQSFSAGAENDGQTIPPRRPQSFQFLENNLMEIDFAGKVFIKQGTIYSYSGNLTFWVKEPRPGGVAPLVIVTGTGKLIVTDPEREITFMHVENEIVYLEPSHLLACEEGLTPNYVPLSANTPGLEVLSLEGRGMVALSVASRPLALSVSPELPVSVRSSSVITWSGQLTAQVVEDPQIHGLMLASPTGALIRLEGTGRVLVEQIPH